MRMASTTIASRSKKSICSWALPYGPLRCVVCGKKGHSPVWDRSGACGSPYEVFALTASWTPVCRGRCHAAWYPGAILAGLEPDPGELVVSFPRRMEYETDLKPPSFIGKARQINVTWMLGAGMLLTTPDKTFRMTGITAV